MIWLKLLERGGGGTPENNGAMRIFFELASQPSKLSMNLHQKPSKTLFELSKNHQKSFFELAVRNQTVKSA